VADTLFLSQIVCHITTNDEEKAFGLHVYLHQILVVVNVAGSIEDVFTDEYRRHWIRSPFAATDQSVDLTD